ncbi:MAG: MBL fold metallo-hydrolase [Chloroflexi bacterium]|nr:MBL fold metallo-hydrolase [Chloroflexota bacterium]
MNIKLTFLGAAQNVTGSRYLLQFNSSRFLVDCGLYQEREFSGRNWEPFPIPPESLGAVLLTHAHLDHCGLLPKLVREGFHGPIYCTAATAEIAEIILQDAGKIQEEDAEFKKKRHEREGRKGPHPEIPLYTADDAKAVSPLFVPVGYGETVKIGEGIEATFYDAGHVLGSSIIKVRTHQDSEERLIIFSGDIGGSGKPILRDPTSFKEADYVLVESTYGDRLLGRPEDSVNELAQVVNNTARAGGNVVIPSFALERSQDVLYYLNKLQLEHRVPLLKVFIDSPMAVSVTDVFKHHAELFDAEMRELLRQGKSPFDFPGLSLVRTVDESKAINNIAGRAIIIAGSGMCTGGRIKHHLVNNISRPESTILFVGYQAIGTLGRQIADGAKEVRILGQYYPVRARVLQLHGFSAHADKEQVLKWLSSLQSPPRRVFVTHGEPEAAQNFARLIRDKLSWKTAVPEYQDEAMLN